jgi:hypothetical protein
MPCADRAVMRATCPPSSATPGAATRGAARPGAAIAAPATRDVTAVAAVMEVVGATEAGENCPDENTHLLAVDGDNGFNTKARRRTETHGGCHAADGLHAGRGPA